MDELIRKYHNGTLTPAELRQLRDQAGALSDEDLAQVLTKNPLRPEPAPEDILNSSIRHMKANIDMATCAPVPWWKRPAMTAASVLIMLAIAAAWIYTGQTGPEPVYGDMAIATGHGQPVTMTLPDGSTVIIGNSSALDFTASHDIRSVTFDGDAYFKVAHAPEGMPAKFEVRTPAMTVNVLGTEFSLSSRNGAESASLILDQGHVLLKAHSSGSTVTLSSGDMATLDTSSGQFLVKRATIAGYDEPWLHNEIVLRDADAKALSSAILNAYGVELPPAMLKIIDTPFTGTLPADDLVSALTILERLYAHSD